MIKAGIITVSDGVYRGERQDANRAIIEELVGAVGAEVVYYKIVPDVRREIEDTLIYTADELNLDIVFTNGGTGFSQRDVTPEATRAVLDREAPGLAEIMRLETWKTSPAAILSRGVCGLRGETLIINLPGSPAGVRECLGIILQQLPHAVRMARLAGGGHE
ncbi:MAG: MogA/MoaB family molybdenum cofactor biosynthesis protein [Candidatus Sumerlaeia bacterium]